MDHRNPEIRAEKTDANAGDIVRFLFWLLFSTVAVAILMRWMFVGLASYQEKRQPLPPVMRAASKDPPLPRLQTVPSQDLAEYHAAQEKALHGYGWVDRSSGVVHIDIDQALKLVAEEGLPVRDDAPAAGPSAVPTSEKHP